mgnify:CR=1 FL=1
MMQNMKQMREMMEMIQMMQEMLQVPKTEQEHSTLIQEFIALLNI